jgi:competence protein ComER
MKVGFIGTGTMGSMLIRTWINNGALDASDIHIYNRTESKALALKDDYPKLVIEPTLQTLLTNTDCVFLCAKPKDIVHILSQHNSLFRKDQVIISITSPISVHDMERAIPSSCARMVPSILNQIQKGSMLLTFSKQCEPIWISFLQKLAESLSNPIETDDDHVRIGADLASCGPAFLCFMLQKMVIGAQVATGLNGSKSAELVKEMIIGTGELLERKNYSLEDLQKLVMVKGGITGKGIDFLENQIGDTFIELFKKTEEIFQEDKAQLKAVWGGS